MAWRRPQEAAVKPTTISDPVTKTPVTMPLPQSPAAYEVAVYILTSVSLYFKMPLRQIIGLQRTRLSVHARYTAIFLIYSWTQLSLVSIGKMFDRDHSTVHTALQKMRDSLDSDNKINDYTEPLLAIEATLIDKYKVSQPQNKG
jgi:chromosomal replication initiation ATPase DnaA